MIQTMLTITNLKQQNCGKSDENISVDTNTTESSVVCYSTNQLLMLVTY